MASVKMQIPTNSIYFLPFYERKVTKFQGDIENINVLVSLPKTQKLPERE